MRVFKARYSGLLRSTDTVPVDRECNIIAADFADAEALFTKSYPKISYGLHDVNLYAIEDDGEAIVYDSITEMLAKIDEQTQKAPTT